MRTLVDAFYYLCWSVCAVLFWAVAYNRYTSGALDLYDIHDLDPELVIRVMQAGVALLLVQTIAIIVRIKRWKKERILEIALSLLAWPHFCTTFPSFAANQQAWMPSVPYEVIVEGDETRISLMRAWRS